MMHHIAVCYKLNAVIVQFLLLANANSTDQFSRTVSGCHTCGCNLVLIIDQLGVMEREHPGSTVTARQIQYQRPVRTTDFIRRPWSP